MSIRMIQQRLQSYDCRTELEEQQAIREISQEVVLAALGRHGFFKQALFQGGTCLRIFFGLNRFSEDMDFILRCPDPEFQLQDHLRHVAQELAAFGYDVEITDKSRADAAVREAFLKDSSLGTVLDLHHANQSGPQAQIRIKVEVDTNPPAGSGVDLQYLDFPFVSAVAVQDLPSLFAGKVHALLCRDYTKGRDWYDFIWYTSQVCDINTEFVTAALNQAGPWQGQGVVADKPWLAQELAAKIMAVDWRQAVEDVRRFVRANEQPSLGLWGRELFLGQLARLGWDGGGPVT